MFKNDQVPADELPQVATIEWQPMDPKFIRLRLTGAGIVVTSIIVTVTVLNFIFSRIRDDVSFGWIWLIALVASVTCLIWPFIAVPRLGYAVRERDIIYKSGVFWRTVTAVPFNRIQHVEKSSTPFDRRYNLAALQLFTAGGSGGDLKIHGLPARDAEKLRAFILDRSGISIDEQP